MRDKNNELVVIKANEMIQKYKYTLSKSEMRVVNAIISNIRSPKYDTELNVMEFDIKEFCKLLGFGEGEIGGTEYRLLKQTLRGLSNKSSDYINFGKYETIVRWIEKPIFEPGSGIVKLKLDDDLKPFLLQASGTMQSKLKYYFAMNSKYSMRLYELLKSWDGVKKKEFEIEELRLSIDAIEKSYESFGKFKQRILDPSVREINEYTDLSISYTTKTRGRKVLAVVFDIARQTEKQVVAVVELESEEPKETPNPKAFKQTEERVSNDDGCEEMTMFEGPNEELSREEQDRRELAETVREILKNGFDYTGNELLEIVVAVLQSEWWELSKMAWFGDAILRHKAFRNYVEAQYVYSINRADSKNKRGFLRYMTKAALDNYFKVPIIEQQNESSFDIDDFFEAACRRSMGDNFDTSTLK